MRNANEIIIPKIEAIYLCCPANERALAVRRWRFGGVYAESEI